MLVRGRRWQKLHPQSHLARRHHNKLLSLNKNLTYLIKSSSGSPLTGSLPLFFFKFLRATSLAMSLCARALVQVLCHTLWSLTRPSASKSSLAEAEPNFAPITIRQELRRHGNIWSGCPITWLCALFHGFDSFLVPIYIFVRMSLIRDFSVVSWYLMWMNACKINVCKSILRLTAVPSFLASRHDYFFHPF